MVHLPAPSKKLRLALYGKQLLHNEVLQSFTQQELDDHFNRKWIDYTPSIITKNYRTLCFRCHNDRNSLFAEHYCYKCSSICTYCRNCINMGKASICNSIVRWIGPQNTLTKIPAEPVLQWNGTLSEPQQLASEQLISSIQSRQSTLVHAVCGAGKTEILFKAIAASLSDNQQVCIATPRRDVVQELFPRFLKAFPTTIIQALYGGSTHRNDLANLTIATTHQLYRYSSAFDVLIIDEVDAFPYTLDPTLQKAAQHARKPESVLIYLSATPNKTMLSEVKKGSLQSVIIPARYHGYSLPEPQTRWIGNWKKLIAQQQLPSAFKEWINGRLSSEKTMLIFVADIESMLILEKVLHRFTSKNICSVHAKDPERSEKIEKMRKKELKILLTTTILERGVTFSNVDVAVLGAEKTIFSESALVQIAGRAGRDYRFPEGNVTFFHYGHTEAIIQAQKHIQRMNKQAAKQGLLTGGKS